MSKIVKIPLIAVSALVSLFLIVFTVYFFNLDMKFMSKFVEPILLKHYDKIPRKQYV